MPDIAIGGNDSRAQIIGQRQEWLVGIEMGKQTLTFFLFK